MSEDTRDCVDKERKGGDVGLLRDAAMAAHSVLAGVSGNLPHQPADVLHDAASRVERARQYLRSGIQGTLHPLSEAERALAESRAHDPR